MATVQSMDLRSLPAEAIVWHPIALTKKPESLIAFTSPRSIRSIFPNYFQYPIPNISLGISIPVTVGFLPLLPRDQALVFTCSRTPKGLFSLPR